LNNSYIIFAFVNRVIHVEILGESHPEYYDVRLSLDVSGVLEPWVGQAGVSVEIVDQDKIYKEISGKP
jgi:hypothetical protein